MKFGQAICIVPLALLSSCVAEMKGPPPPPPPPPHTIGCDDLAGHIWNGTMTDSASGVQVDVTLNFTLNGQPGFKHNVQMSMQLPPNLLPQDAECYDSTTTPPATPTIIKVYKADTVPALASLEATWTVSTVVPPGSVFHVHDPGSTLFLHGADGNFK